MRLQRQDGAGGDGVQAIAHYGFQQVKLLLPGTVAGVVGAVQAQQAVGSFSQKGFVLGSHKMEAADENVRPEVLGNGHDAFMGAAAYEDPFATFLNEKVLFVAEILPLAHTGGHSGIICRREGHGMQSNAGSRLSEFLGEDQTPAGRRLPEPNVFTGCIEMGLKSVTAEVQGGILIALKKGLHSAAVVIMAMGEHSEVYLGKVNAQYFCIVCKSMALAHVEQNFMATGFQIQAQAMLADKRRRTGGIFDEGDQVHGDLRGKGDKDEEFNCQFARGKL